MGKTAQIQIKGIQRNSPKGSDNDGGCQELINLRPEKAAWRPVGEKSSIDDTTLKYTKYIHRISDSKVAHWFVDGTDIGYRLYVNGVSTTTDTTFDTTSSSGKAKFSSLGYVVIMMETNSEELQAYVFENDNNTYRLVGDLLPDLVQATIRPTDIGFTSYTNIFRSTIAELDEVIQGEVENHWVENYRDNGYWLNAIYFRYAYELFDGSIVKHSQPIRVSGSFVDTVVETGATIFQYRYYLREVIFKIIDTSLATIKSTYPGIINSVNIYVSRPREDFSLSDTAQGTTPNRYYTATMEPTKIDKIDNFYLVKSIALSELSTSDVDPLDGVELNSLITNNTLPIDNLTAHKIYSDNPFVYNQRLIFSTIKNTLFKGFVPDLSNPYDQGSGSSYQFRLEVTIATPEGDKLVRSDLSVQTYQSTNILGVLECFAYPDKRASKVRILVYYGGNYYYHNDIALTPHKLFNFSFIEDPYWEDDVGTALQTVVDTYRDENRIQASELYNPFYYPNLNSYRVANASIVGLGTNAEAISTSQFGAYPIYTFTNDGIWTLEIGQQGVFVQSIKPLSRHVCNNVDSIVSITGGVLFSTDSGLFVIAGSQILEISQFAEGAYESPLSLLGSKLHMPLVVETSASTYESTWMPKQRAVTYNGKTYFAYYAAGQYYVAELDQADNTITNRDPNLAASGTVFDCSMCIDSSGYLYIITTRSLSFYYKKSTNPGDASAWDSEVAVGPFNVTGGIKLSNPILLSIGTELVCVGTYEHGLFSTIWKDYTSSGVWHGQEQVIVELEDDGYVFCNAEVDSDGTLHISWCYFDTGNYVSLHYIKSYDPLVTVSSYVIANGDDISVPIEYGGGARILLIGDYPQYDVTLGGMVIYDDVPYILGLLTNGVGDPSLIMLSYVDSAWIVSEILESSSLPSNVPTETLAFDGAITVMNGVIKVAYPVTETNGDGNAVTSIHEWVTTNKGLTWDLIGKHIPAGTDDYTCITYPIGLTNDCFLVALYGSTDYGTGRAIRFLVDDVCQIKFLDYLEGAVLGYDPINNEILVSNSTYVYSWVFDIDNKMWFKISQVWDAFVINFPGLNGYRTVSSVYYRYDMVDENESDAVSFYIETRPIGFGAKGYKKIERSMIDAYLEPDLPEYLGVLLYGSVDNGVTYRLVAAGNITEVKNQFLIGRSKYSCQFFILVIGGEVEFASTVNDVTFDVKGKFQSKLR